MVDTSGICIVHSSLPSCLWQILKFKNLVMRHACVAHRQLQSGSLSISCLRLSTMEEYGYSPRRSLYSGSYDFGDSHTSGYKMLNCSMDPVQLVNDVLVCLQELSMILLFTLGIGTNPVSEFETTSARIPSVGTCACMWVCVYSTKCSISLHAILFSTAF